MVFHKATAGTEPGVLRGSDLAQGYTSQSSGQPPFATENNPILHWSPLKNVDDQPSRNLNPSAYISPFSFSATRNWSQQQDLRASSWPVLLPLPPVLMPLSTFPMLHTPQPAFAFLISLICSRKTGTSSDDGGGGEEAEQRSKLERSPADSGGVGDTGNLPSINE